MEHLLPPGSVTAQVESWLKEDVPTFDYGGYVVGCTEETAILYGKTSGCLAGCPWFDKTFELLGSITEVARVTGPAARLLQGERVALNVIARASGIATRARRMHQLKQQCDYKGIIAGTRKTTPGFRLVEKYAMIVGGCDTHRMDLSSMIMLKDNHIWSQGSITKAVAKAKQVGGFSVKIEVEARSESEAREAIAAGADIVMLDNFTPGDAKQVAMRLKVMSPHVLLEVSGGITEDSIATYFSPDIDILSMGAMSQSVPHLDFSLKIRKSSH